ncbi:MAG TPA: fibronectin type III domain-containing protein [Acidimicrobiales bacterium]|nr:fibronectin type III domain-containing protein [Acidimicrobiales bacterium]
MAILASCCLIGLAGPAAAATPPDIPTGAGASGIAIDSGRGLVYVANATDGTVSVLSTLTNTVVQTVDVAPGITAVAVDPTTGTVLVSNGETLYALSELASSVSWSYQLATADSPADLAVDPDTGLVFAVGTNNIGTNDVVTVVSDRTQQLVKRFTLAGEPSSAAGEGLSVAADPPLGRSFVAQPDGTIYVIDEASLTTTQWTGYDDVYSIALDPSGDHLYVAALESVNIRPLATNWLYDIDASTGATLTSQFFPGIVLPFGPSSLAPVPALGELMELDGGNGVDTVLWPNPPTNSTQRIPVTDTATALAVDPATSVAYVTESSAGAVAVVDPRGTADLPGAPLLPTATAGDRSVSVNWTAPLDPGASPVTGYVVAAAPVDGSIATVVVAPAAATSATVGGLRNAVPYTVTVTAENSSGAGSPASTVAMPVGPELPTTTAVSVPATTYYGHLDSVSATVRPVPDGGTVEFAQNGAVISGCGSQPVSLITGTAICTFEETEGGSPTLLALYSGDDDYAWSYGQAQQPVVSPPCPTAVTHQAPGTPIGTQTMTGMVDGVTCPGYWVVTTRGGVTAVGAAPWHGDLAGVDHPPSPIVAMAATGDSGGYILVAADGGVFSYGNAKFYGSPAGRHLSAPIVSVAFTPDGGGYWMTASDGGVFAYGDAQFQGSTGGLHLYRPIVSMSVDKATGGYWLTASDGGVFAFRAPFFGSTGSIRLAKPIVSMSPTANDRGYRFVASDGGVFSFGQAPFYGSLGGRAATAPGVGAMTTSITGSGYYLFDDASRIWTFGPVPHLG